MRWLRGCRAVRRFGSEFRGSGFRVQGSGFQVPGSGSRFRRTANWKPGYWELLEGRSGKLGGKLIQTASLVIDKPAGPTSHDVVARVRRALGTSRIGHTGTLDPLATGVLPLVVGRATRLASLFSGAEKEYDAGVRLGLATDTYDAAHLSGPVPDAPAGIGADAIEAALEAFRGTYSQAPPAYSAKKINGVAAYKLARRNEPVQPRAVTVTVHRLTLLSYANGLAQLRVHCSAGFYVRSLAHDLGARLGCGAHLESLRRTRAGSFDESAAVPLAEVESEGPDAARRLVP